MFALTLSQAFRDEHGNPTDHKGLRLRLTDFAYEELAHREIQDEDRELIISTRELCKYLNVAEAMTEQSDALGEHALDPRIKKRKRSETPPENINSDDEARYLGEEEREAKRVAQGDLDYKDTL